MLSWLFKTRVGFTPAPAPRPPAPPKPPPPPPVDPAVAQAAAAAKAEARAAAQADWAARLQAALGDDTALLQVAEQAPLLETKVAAVQALAGEAALKQAERVFRSHDRKVHKLARTRLDALVSQRQARAGADALIEAAASLAAEPRIALNRLVELDRQWQALGVQQLEPAQTERYASLRAQIDANVRAESDARQRQQQWLADAAQALDRVRADTLQAAQAGLAADLAAALAAGQALLETQPIAAACTAPGQALKDALQSACHVQSRLAWLQAHAEAAVAASRPPAAEAAADGEAASTDEAAATGDDDAAAVATAAPADEAVASGQPTPAVDEPAATGLSGEDPGARAPVAPQAPTTDAADVAGAIEVAEPVSAAGPGDATVSTDAVHAVDAESAVDSVDALEAAASAEIADAPAPFERPADSPAAAVDAVVPAPRWQDLPALPDGELAALLQQRHDALLLTLRPRKPVRAPAAPVAAPAAVRAPRAPALAPEQRQQLDEWLAHAEQAQADGEPGQMQQHLQAIDTLLATLGGAQPGERWRTRHQALVAERARLNAWRQWGGARARDDLADEAEALARATAAAADTTQPHPPKLRLKEHAEAIQSLRLRWKELDRLGAVASQALWGRFDAALHLAYAPVAAQQALLKATREENLRQREALLATLDALPESPADAGAEATAHFWKEQLHALAAFHTSWRQLGPIEHTVPAASRKGLQQRLQHSLARVENPLQAAREQAQAVREHLIAQAEALLPGAAEAPVRELMPRLRELQAAWQQQARALPLARGVETGLWARFKATTDAVFAQREAAFHARDAELAAHAAAREELLQRLQALAGDTPMADLERSLADIDRAWRQAGEPPRGAAAALEARYRQAREAAQQRLQGQAWAAWQARCDNVSARLALCECREDGAPEAAELAPRWDAALAEPLPPPADRAQKAAAAWGDLLQQRWAAAAAPPAATGPLPAPAYEDLLLDLEACFDVPATPESQAARRQLKLRALKATLEGGSLPTAQRGPLAERVAAALRQRGTTDAQRSRLRAIVAALRGAPATLLDDQG